MFMDERYLARRSTDAKALQSRCGHSRGNLKPGRSINVARIVAGFLALVALCQVFTGVAFDRGGFYRLKDDPTSYWIALGFWAGDAAAVYVFAH
jgi:hypothetical protein